MRIAQVLFPGASLYEQKCQRIDVETLRAEHDVTTVASEADLAHFYAPHNLGSRAFRGVGVPIVANVLPKKRWFGGSPNAAISPVEKPGFQIVPEAVEEQWFKVCSGGLQAAGGLKPAATLRVASIARRSTHSMVQQTVARIHRTREDIEWIAFDAVPSPADLANVAVWVDPAVDEDDYDGFVAEALVCGLPVAASRTTINTQRLEKGRTGFLVPPGDANELTHAILTALFKREVAEQKQEAAGQTAAKFRPRQRLRALLAVYRSVLT